MSSRIPTLRSIRNDRSKLKRTLLEVQQFDFLPSRLRHAILKVVGAKLASTSFFEAGIQFVSGRLIVGSDAYVNRGSLLDCRGGIVIGDRTLVGPRVNILTATHPIMDSYPRAGPVEYSGVIIEADVWIGAASVSYTHLTLPTICSV